jgi:hypothetical protein
MTTVARIPAFRYSRRSEACEDPRSRCLHRPQEVKIQIPDRRRSAGQCPWLVTKLVTAGPLIQSRSGHRPTGGSRDLAHSSGTLAISGMWSWLRIQIAQRRNRAADGHRDRAEMAIRRMSACYAE